MKSVKEAVEGDPCHRDLGSITGGVQAVVIGTRPGIAGATERECELGIKHVRMHRGPGPDSVSEEAANSAVTTASP